MARANSLEAALPHGATIRGSMAARAARESRGWGYAVRLAWLLSGGPAQSQGAPLVREARRQIHETRDAIAAWQGSAAGRVDQRRVEEGQRQRHAGSSAACVCARGEFGDVGDWFL